MKKIKLIELIDEMPGGKGDDTDPKDVDQKELEIGIAVEREHTDDSSKAEEIALDHLTEDPKYYTKLVKSGIVDEKEALEIYKKYFSGLQEKAKSKAQQQFMGMVHAAQKGEKPASKKVADVAKSMKKSDVRDFAKTKHKGLPKHIKEAAEDRTSPPPRDGDGLIIVTNDEKYVFNTNVSPPQKHELKKGMDITNFIRDFNVISAKHTIDYYNKKGQWKILKTPYDYNKNRKYRGGQVIKENEMNLGSLVKKDVKKDVVKEEEPPLTLEDKKSFLEDIKKLEEYGQKLYSPVDLVELAEKLSALGKMAERVTLEETDNWFDKVTINRNMKECKKISEDITKAATEAKSVQQRLTSLYEDLKHVLGRYFEISDLGANSKTVVQDQEGDVYNQAGQNTSFDYLKNNFEDFRSADEANKLRIKRAKRNIS